LLRFDIFTAALHNYSGIFLVPPAAARKKG
jgi:hypothetical protein